MKKRTLYEQNPELNFTEARGARTGEHCPMEGWREHVGRTAAWQGIAKGSVLQTDNSPSVGWMLVASESRHPRPKDGHSFPGDTIGSF